MKQRVSLSGFSCIVTLMCIVLFGFFAFFNNPPLFIKIALSVILVLMCLAGLFYMPLSIAADQNGIYVRRSLKIKTIPLSEVKEVRICPPTMTTVRLCGSGGFMGYWGWFRVRNIGKYFAYYGRAKDCFIVELHNGKKYMLGCNNHQQMVDYINSLIK